MVIRTASKVIEACIEMTFHSASMEANNSIPKLNDAAEMAIRDALSNGRNFCSVESKQAEDSSASESLESSGG